ncbi:flagellar motor switch protein FliN [Candidatus Symbiobacter mobilis]|uniref:Flagellar motor switch protein FliN n=1 Tax=Candidatus Symbiobacter mobilis CR TaxID=946483 RepID=U5NAQ0_9BURK|nr:flagellar motor switch protein FliN [Candidatus Symbiobacter mobilis]AGX88365.1 flagellar motor switch protein FliNY [Candidatus Symbiobacter mobilis CR]
MADDDETMDDWAEALMEQRSADETPGGGPPGGVLSDEPVRPFSTGSNAADAPIQDINRVLDIPVQLSVELGRTKVPIKHILQLGQGSVVELDALAGEPMDVLVNGYLIAQGEVVVVNDKFGIRLTDVVTPSERLRRVSKNG